MKKLKLKDLHTLLGATPPDARKRVAARAKTSVPMLSQYANGHRKASAARAIQIEKATNGAVRRETTCEACGKCELAKIARNVQDVLARVPR